jgi:hypothetical protein
MLTQNVIGDRFADAVFLDAGIHSVAACQFNAVGYGFAGISDAVGFNQLNAGLIGDALFGDHGKQGEGIAAFKRAAEGKRLQAIEVLRAGYIAKRAIRPETPFAFRTPFGRLLRSPSKAPGVELCLQRQAGSNHALYNGSDRSDRKWRIAQ